MKLGNWRIVWSERRQRHFKWNTRRQLRRLWNMQRSLPLIVIVSGFFLGLTNVIAVELNSIASNKQLISQPRSRSSSSSSSSSASASIGAVLSSSPLTGLISASPGVCQSLPMATRDQTALCQRYPDVMSSALQGLRIAVHECQHQFRRNRWNCSTVESSKTRSLQSSVIMSKGYRESAFVHAIAAAGVAHAVARACSMGKLMSCSCGKAMDMDWPDGLTEEQVMVPLNNGGRRQHSSWRWSGCNHNLDFGVHFSKLMLNSREKAKDVRSRVNIHNNKVGRMAISNNMEIKCKCHGMSGSCELKTCWKASRNFRRVGVALKDRFRRALLVSHANSGHRARLRLAVPLSVLRSTSTLTKTNNPNGISGIGNMGRVRKQRRPQPTDLVYLQRSPNFCELDPTVESLGTKSRICNKTSSETDNCDSLCCGKGYNTIRQRRVERCHCRFKWCCHVTCKECVYEEWVTVCK